MFSRLPVSKVEFTLGRIALGAALLSLIGADAADAAVKHQPHSADRVVSIAAPSNDALVRTDVVPVRLNVGSKVSRVRVFAGTKDVSRRFTLRGRTYTARLPRALFKPGTNRLLVQAEAGKKPGGATSVSFVVPRSGRVSMRTASGAQASAAALGAQPPAGQVPVTITTKTATSARLKVNGRVVADLRAARPLTQHSWLVSARDGLKPGRNVFVAESWDAKGRNAVKRWTVTRDRSLPMTEAGPRERVIAPHRWATLDGSESRTTRGAGKLGYAWRVVSAPKGAMPALRNATSAKPRFQPDKPGVYKVALRATQTRSVAHAADVGSASEDVITLDAVPPLGAQGLYVDTGIIWNGGPNTIGPPDTLMIEGQPYSSFTNGQPDTFVQLDETTLAVTASGPHANIVPAPGLITIGAWIDTSVPGTPGRWGSEIWIGTRQVALNNTDTDPGADNGNPTSNLHGWIQPASVAGTDNATWVDSDMLQVKTRQPADTPSTTTMEINGQTFPHTLSAGETGGWQMTVLDHSAKASDTLYPLTGNAGKDGVAEDQLASDIKNVGWGSTILLQAFGNVPAVSSASNLANAIQSIGGRADVVDRFNGKTDPTGGVYALISAGSRTANNAWSNDAADEASFERTGATGTLSALLVRDATENDYIPFSSDSGMPDAAGSSRYDFLPLIYQAPTDWTNWIRNDDGTLRAPSAAESAAYADLLSQVVRHHWVPATQLCPTAPDAIRGYYCDTDPVKLETLLSHISSQLTFNATTAGGRYTQADWTTVQDTIEDEIGDVSNLRSTITDYQALFGTASLDGAVNAPAIGTAIQEAITKTTTTTTNAQLDNVLSALTDMASVVPDIGPEMTFISGAFGLMSNLEPNTSPQAILDQVQVTQTTAATTLVAAFQNASTRLSNYGDLVVADPVKLQQGALFLLNNDPQTSDTNSAFVHAAEYATQQWLWGTELAPAYSVWVVPRVFGWSPMCSVNDKLGNPWTSLSPSGRWASSIGVGSANTTWHWLLGYDQHTDDPNANTGFALASGQELTDTSLPSSISDPLFGQPVSSTTAPRVTANTGATMPYFALDYLTIKFPPQMAESGWSQNPSAQGCEPDNGVPSPPSDG